VRQLQEDIQKMKGHKAAVLRRMELREREFREWRTARERELAQLRRSAQRQNAALQQHQAMHVKQQVRRRVGMGPFWLKSWRGHQIVRLVGVFGVLCIPAGSPVHPSYVHHPVNPQSLLMPCHS
jgi:hypothetical protein